MLGQWYDLILLPDESLTPAVEAIFPATPGGQCGGRLGGAWHRPGFVIPVAKVGDQPKKPRRKTKDIEWLLKPL